MTRAILNRAAVFVASFIAIAPLSAKAAETLAGKTVTLQVLADHFSRIGVPVFVADVKGDLSGVAAAGAMSPKLAERLKSTGISQPAFAAWEHKNLHRRPRRLNGR